MNTKIIAIVITLTASILYADEFDVDFSSFTESRMPSKVEGTQKPKITVGKTTKKKEIVKKEQKAKLTPKTNKDLQPYYMLVREYGGSFISPKHIAWVQPIEHDKKNRYYFFRIQTTVKTVNSDGQFGMRSSNDSDTEKRLLVEFRNSVLENVEFYLINGHGK